MLYCERHREAHRHSVGPIAEARPHFSLLRQHAVKLEVVLAGGQCRSKPATNNLRTLRAIKLSFWVINAEQVILLRCGVDSCFT